MLSNESKNRKSLGKCNFNVSHSGLALNCWIDLTLLTDRWCACSVDAFAMGLCACVVSHTLRVVAGAYLRPLRNFAPEIIEWYGTWRWKLIFKNAIRRREDLRSVLFRFRRERKAFNRRWSSALKLACVGMCALLSLPMYCCCKNLSIHGERRRQKEEATTEKTSSTEASVCRQKFQNWSVFSFLCSISPIKEKKRIVSIFEENLE